MIETNGFEVSGWIEKEKEELEEDVEKMIEDTIDGTLDRAKKEVPVDTGALKESLQKDDESVFSRLDYAPHVGLGTIYQDRQDYLWGPAKKELREQLKELANG